MTSTPTPRLRLEQQAAGSNLSTWGDPHLNQALQRVEESTCGFCSFTLSGSLSLSTSNFTGDQAHYAVLNVTGGLGGTVTIPSLEKLYTIINNSAGTLSLTTGAGLVVTLQPGDISQVACDSSNCFLVRAASFVSVPAQGGNNGNFLQTNGVNLSWVPIQATNVAGLGGAATLNIGTTSGTVAAGDDSRIVNALPVTGGIVGDGTAASSPLSVLSSNSTGLEFAYNSNAGFIDFHSVNGSFQAYDARIASYGPSSPTGPGQGNLIIAAASVGFTSSITAPGFNGPLNGNVTGNVSGSASYATSAGSASSVPAGTITSAMMSGGAAVGNLGYVPVNKAGDTMSGPLSTPSLSVAAGDLTLGRNDTAMAYIVRPAVAGYKQLGFAVAGGGQLDSVTIFSGSTTITGTLSVAGAITASGGVVGTASNAAQLGGQSASTSATANTVAARDGSGNLTANTFNGALNGNATSATSASSATTASTTANGNAGFAIGGLTGARVASGTGANSGRISWGTGSPGTLAVGEIYLQVAAT